MGLEKPLRINSAGMSNLPPPRPPAPSATGLKGKGRSDIFS